MGLFAQKPGENRWHRIDDQGYCMCSRQIEPLPSWEFADQLGTWDYVNICGSCTYSLRLAQRKKLAEVRVMNGEGHTFSDATLNMGLGLKNGKNRLSEKQRDALIYQYGFSQGDSDILTAAEAQEVLSSLRLAEASEAIERSGGVRSRKRYWPSESVTHRRVDRMLRRYEIKHRSYYLKIEKESQALMNARDAEMLRERDVLDQLARENLRRVTYSDALDPSDPETYTAKMRVLPNVGWQITLE